MSSNAEDTYLELYRL